MTLGAGRSSFVAGAALICTGACQSNPAAELSTRSPSPPQVTQPEPEAAGRNGRVLFDGDRLRVVQVSDRAHAIRALGSGQGKFVLEVSDAEASLGDFIAVETLAAGPQLRACEHDLDDRARAESYARFVVHEDELLRVLRIEVGPGQESGPIFFDDPGFVYIDHPARLRFTYLGGSGDASADRAGPIVSVREHHWNEGEPPHSVKVVGTTALRVFRFEVKSCRS